MIKYLFFLPLLSYFLTGCQGVSPVNHFTAEKIPTIQSMIITEASIESQSEHTKEPLGVCEGYALSLADVNEFLEKAKVVETEYDYLPKSRCWTMLEMTFQNGEIGGMIIERSRRGLISIHPKGGSPYLSDHKSVALYCSECSNKKYYDAVRIQSNAEVEASRQAIEKSVIEMLAKGNFKTDEINNLEEWKESDHIDYISSFETESSCKEFDLTATDIQEFFKKSHLLSNESTQETVGSNLSRCLVRGSALLQNGETIFWRIDKARNGIVQFSDNPEGVFNKNLNFFCRKCNHEKFYSQPQKNLSDFRPVIKNITIEENGACLDNDSSEEIKNNCLKFRLNETEILEFFKVARSSSSMEFNNHLPVSPCYISGRAVLNDGIEATWWIDAMLRGHLITKEGVFRYYCDDCQDEKFYEAFDWD